MIDADEEDDSCPAFPLGVRIAGMIWVFFGGLGLLGGVIGLVSWVLGGGEVSCCGTSCFAIFASWFLGIGLMTVQGEAADTLAIGASSIVISLFWFGTAALVSYAALSGAPGGGGRGLLLVTAPFAGFGSLLLSAGVLALAGRSRYLEWRNAQPPSSGDHADC